MSRLNPIISICLVALLFACKPHENDDQALKQRLNEFLVYFKKLDGDKAIDYLYPKIFTIIDRNSEIELMRKERNSANGEVDSIIIDSLFPIFAIDNGRYAKIEYSIYKSIDTISAINVAVDFSMALHRKDDTASLLQPIAQHPKSQMVWLTNLLSEKYGPENVSLDSAAGNFHLRSRNIMVAVKDDYAKKWSFVNFEANDSFYQTLFSREVLSKLNSQ